MAIFKNKYSEQKISMLKHFLENSSQSGKPRDYEIFVDEMKVIERTNNKDEFENYEEFINDETRTVTVVLYDGQSRRNNRHVYYLKEETQKNTLSGIDVDKIIDEKVAHHKREWEFEKLIDENGELKNQISEAEEYIVKQGKSIEELKEKRKWEDREFGEIASAVVENLIRRNTHLLKKVPGMEGLAGILEKDNKTPQQQPIPAAEASFSKNGSVELNDEQKGHLEILKQMQEVFSNENLEKVLHLSKIFIQKPKAIAPTITFAEQWKEPVSSSASSIEKK